jgi:hypothetical protein
MRIQPQRNILFNSVTVLVTNSLCNKVTTDSTSSLFNRLPCKQTPFNSVNLQTHPTCCTIGTGTFPGVKRQGRDADPSTHSSTEI